MDTQTSLKRSNTVQNVLKELRRDIILYKYKNQMQITETHLSEVYHCSRAALRSAYIVLEKEGLIVTKENGTKEISCLDKNDIDNLYELRNYLELSAIKHCQKNLSKDYSALLGLVNQMVNAKNLSLDEILELDAQFHTALVKLSQNKALIQAWLNISDVIRELFSMNMTESTVYKNWFMDHFFDRHMEIMTTLMSSPDKILPLLEKHISDAHETSLKAVKKLEEN